MGDQAYSGSWVCLLDPENPIIFELIILIVVILVIGHGLDKNAPREYCENRWKERIRENETKGSENKQPLKREHRYSEGRVY